MEEGAHRGPHGLWVVEVGAALREGGPRLEGVGRAEHGANVARVLYPVQEDEAFTRRDQLLRANVQERENPDGPGRGGKGREATNLFRLGEEPSRRLPGLEDQACPLGQKESFGLPMLFLIEPSRPLERDPRGPPATRRQPALWPLYRRHRR